MIKGLYGVILLLFTGSIAAQERKAVEAYYTDQPITIDGILDEPAYSNAKPAVDFTQLQPYNGKPAMEKSEVYILFDQNAIYVGGMFYDHESDSIFNFLSERDDIGSSDYFGIYFDPYNQGLLAYGFFITPAGVQLDMKAIREEFDNEDGSWDAVWQSKTRVTDEGWIAEFKIPYSALRFSENSDGVWGVNMFRNVRRYASNSSWNFIDNKVNGFIHQQGILTGIKDIKPPVRLSVTPFIAAYSTFISDQSSPDYSYKAGMDLKYGISDAYTLDMMLVPDFGQIQSDDQQLNLTPYELYYSEKRQFFTEGMELFNKADIFYSRRIGARPKFASRAEDALVENEEVNFSPSETQLLNATKISGRSSKGWGVGFLNAMSLPSYATIRDTITGLEREFRVQPFTNYNVLVVEKGLKNNSYVSLINTNMSMVDDPYRANVTAADFQIRDKTKTYALSGKGGVSIKKDDDQQTGYFADWKIGKNSGKWQYSLSQHIVSEDFNSNDLGYLRRNNELNTQAFVGFYVFEPVGIFKRINTGVFWNHNRIYHPGTFSLNVFGINYYSSFMNNWGFEYYFRFNSKSYDYYEPRVDGWYYTSPYSLYNEIWAYSDGRKPLQVVIGYTNLRRPETDKVYNSVDFVLNYRLGRHFKFSYNLELEHDKNYRGYVDNNESEDTIYFARRNINTVENVLETSYSINNKAGINFRIRHYWSGAENKQYFRLLQNGSLVNETDYNEDKDENYNAFNIDLVFRWIFAPGSEFSVAWKNAISTDGNDVRNNYWDNLKSTWKSTQNNSFSIRMLYYIDYNSIRRKRS